VTTGEVARGRRLRTATWIAVGVTAVAVAALVLLAVVSATTGFPIDGPLAVLGSGATVFVLIAWAASSGGYVLALVARARSDVRKRALRWTAALLAPVMVLGWVALAVGVLVWVAFSHPFAANPAADAGRRLSAQIRAQGGEELCTDGDPGLGPDNVQPWYMAWVEVPMSSADDAALRSAFVRAGFRPTVGKPGAAVAGKVTATADRLGTTDVEIDCAGGFQQWGRTHTAARGSEVLVLQVQLPPRQ
jgi:hypothetical protein